MAQHSDDHHIFRTDAAHQCEMNFVVSVMHGKSNENGTDLLLEQNERNDATAEQTENVKALRQRHQELSFAHQIEVSDK